MIHMIMTSEVITFLIVLLLVLALCVAAKIVKMLLNPEKEKNITVPGSPEAYIRFMEEHALQRGYTPADLFGNSIHPCLWLIDYVQQLESDNKELRRQVNLHGRIIWPWLLKKSPGKKSTGVVASEQSKELPLK